MHERNLQFSAMNGNLNCLNGTSTTDRNKIGKLQTDFESSNSSTDEQNNKLNPTAYIIFFSLLLDLLAFTMILPLFPSLLEFYETNEGDNFYAGISGTIRNFQKILGVPDRYNSVLFGGFLGSMFSFLQFIVSPIVGGLSDVYGRKPIILLCALGITSSYFLWSLSSNFGIFVIARFVGGLSKGNISLSMAIVTDVSNSKTRPRAMALVGIAFSLGFIMGPMIGAVFSLYSDKTSRTWFWLPAICATTLALADFLFLCLHLKETLPKEKRAKHLVSSLTQATEFIRVSSIFNFSPIKNLPLKDMMAVRKLGLIYFLYLFVYSALEFTVTFLMYHKFGYTSIDQARMFLTTGVIMAILQGTVVRRLPATAVKKYAVFGLYLIVPGYFLVGIAESSVILYAGMILFAISTAFVVTCMTTIVSKYGRHNQKGTILGIFRSLGALARAVGPIFGSVAFWSIGSKATYVIGSILLFYPAVLLQKHTV